ncbi:MAG: polysaccharide deacetylase family protein [Candidatus Omnitrophica bacterium]|nr:polysaccharide deacetylase family protein [Candidatus Omnitrophota bacterium]
MKRARIIAAVTIIVAIAAVFIFLKTAYVVPVLMYHSIDYNDNVSKLSVNPESFERQMKFLHDNKYNVVTLAGIAGYIRGGGKIPRKTVAVTFDDGFYNNYEYAFPVLKKYNIPATIFIITGKIGEKGFVGWKEIRQMADSGVVTIGSHTVSHKWLPSMGTRQLESELRDSRALLEEKLGIPVTELCYPLGAHDERVKREAVKTGYKCAVATNPGRFSPWNDLYAIKRVRISRTSDNLFVFWMEISGYYTWIKEHRDD